MNDGDCIEFLQWALPRMRMQWQGFRKVRRQVCKRVLRRVRALQLRDIVAYKSHLEDDPSEWVVLDGLCRVTISRFYRDSGVYRFVEQQVLPDLCHRAVAAGESVLRVLSAGCGSGEEPYTMVLLWEMVLQSQFSGLDACIVAIDSDADLIRRCNEARYSASSVRDLPEAWRRGAFEESDGVFSLYARYKSRVSFAHSDLRVDEMPHNTYHLVLCRNLAFTYWDQPLQLEVAIRIRKSLITGGALVIGTHERIPDRVQGFAPWLPQRAVYRAIL